MAYLKLENDVLTTFSLVKVWNMFKVTTILGGLSRQVVFTDREDKHDNEIHMWCAYIL